MIIGIDTASNRMHWVADEEVRQGLSYGYCKAFSANPDERRMTLFLHARNLFGVLPLETQIFCEEPLALAKNGKTTRLLGLAAGAIWAAHLDFDLWWHWVDYASWKKRILGSGSLPKARIPGIFWQMELAGEDRQEAYDAESDFYDAHCLMWYGEWYMENARMEVS